MFAVNFVLFLFCFHTCVFIFLTWKKSNLKALKMYEQLHCAVWQSCCTIPDWHSFFICKTIAQSTVISEGDRFYCLDNDNNKIHCLSPTGCMWMWMANYKCQRRSLQSLPSLWEFTELSAEPERFTFCSEYKMLIHAAGNPELGERVVVLTSSLSPLSLPLSLSLFLHLTVSPQLCNWLHALLSW